MADFEEDGAANMASHSLLNDDHMSHEHDLITGEHHKSSDHDSQLDPFSLNSYSGMDETDPSRFQDENIKESDLTDSGDAIAGGYTYYDRTDDLPANFARAQQSHVHGDEASDEVEHHTSGSNPFMDGEKDTGLSSGGYVDDRPIIGYNPFLNEDERCRADGQEVAEALDNQENKICQQYEAREDETEDAQHDRDRGLEADQFQRDGETENAQHDRDHGLEADQFQRDGETEDAQYDRGHEQEIDQYQRDDEDEQETEQYYKDDEQESEQYYREQAQESEQCYKDEGQENEQYYREEAKESEQGYKDEEQDSEQGYKDEEQDSEQDYKDDRQDLKDYEKDHLPHNEQEVEGKQNVYDKLEEYGDGADLEMDPVDNIQDVESEYRGQFEAVGCKLFGDGPVREPEADQQSNDQSESVGTDIDGGVKYESDAVESPKAISCAMFGDGHFNEENKQTAQTIQDVLEESYPSEPTTCTMGEIDDDKQYVYDDGDKVQADEQYEDDQEHKEYEEYGHDQREPEFIPQSERSNEDLGIVNQAFTDDVDNEDKQIEENAIRENINREEGEMTSELDKANIMDQDDQFVSSSVRDLEYSPRKVETVDTEEKIQNEVDEDDQEEIEEKEENILEDDNVIQRDKNEIRDLGFEQQIKENDMFSSQHQDRNYVDNLSELTSPDTVPQPLPSPPEPKDMSPFDPNAPSDSPSPCQENLGQHGDTADENNTGDFLSVEVEGETKFGVDGTAVTSTNTHNGTFIHSEDEEEEETEEESQQLDQGCITATGTTETETSVDERSGEYVGHDMETNDNALMSMSMEGSFYDDGGELIGGEDRRAQQNHLYHDEDRYVEQNVELNQQIQNCYSQPSHDSFGLQDDYTQNASGTHDVTSAVNGDVDSLLDAPVTAQGLQTPVTEHDNVVDSSVDITETDEYQSNVDASHLVDESVESDAPGESSIDAVGISSPPDEQSHDQKDLEEALGSIQISEPASEKAEEPSSSVDEIAPNSKSEEALAAAAAPAAVTGIAAAAAAASVSSTKTTVKKTTSAKAGTKTTTTTTTKTAKENKTTDGKPASAKKIETTTTTVTKTSKKPTDTRPTSGTTTEKKSSAKPTTTSSTKSSTPVAPKPSGAAPSYAQPITPRKPREPTLVSSEEKKKTPRTPSATARTPKTQSATTSTTSTTTSTITKTTARTSAVSSTTTSRTAQLARPKSSPTKLTNGTSAPHSTLDTNKSPTKKSEPKPSSATVRVSSEKKEIKATSKVDAGTKTTTTISTPKSPTKPSTPRTPSATTPKAGEVKEVKEVKSKIGSLEKTTHSPGGGNVKITSKKTDFTNVTSKIGSKDKIDHKPGGGNIRIENKKLKIEAKSKIGSLDNASHKPSGGDKKIESRKLDFKEKASPKIGSLDPKKAGTEGATTEVPTTNGVSATNGVTSGN